MGKYLGTPKLLNLIEYLRQYIQGLCQENQKDIRGTMGTFYNPHVKYIFKAVISKGSNLR